MSSTRKYSTGASSTGPGVMPIGSFVLATWAYSSPRLPASVCQPNRAP